MTAYADSNFYTTKYLCGKKAVIDSASFNFYAHKATRLIKQYTFNNIQDGDAPECVKMCCCEVAELIFNNDNSSAAQGITSESVGDQSVSYESSYSMKQLLQSNIRSAVYSWLTGTGLLYRGVGKC